MNGLTRSKGTVPDKKTPLLRSDLERIIDTLPNTLTGIRDKAILLVGFAGAFRRSELAGLTMRDILRTEHQLIITLRRSKTDQEGRGLKKHLPVLPNNPLCPVAALQAWLDAAAIHSGPVFRKVDRWGKVWPSGLDSSGHAIAIVVKNAVTAAGLNPKDFAGHSLRSGFITSAALVHVAEYDIMGVSKHRSASVLRGYIQDAGAGELTAITQVLS